MKVHYLALFGAIAGLSLAVGTTTQLGFGQKQVTSIQPAHAACAANPCAANPCAANPCAANPCAANPCAASAGQLAIYTENGIAVDGTDVVAYFTEGEAVAGSSDFTYQWGGSTWQFSSEENRELFASNPEGYAPQYGGYCAWAAVQNQLAPTDPEAWKIVQGKLYLNLNSNIQRRWERDIPGNIAKADSNWPDLSQL